MRGEALAIEHDCFRCRVDSQNSPAFAGKAAGPEAGAASQLKDVSPRKGRFQRRFHDRHLAKPLVAMRRSSIIATLPEEPLIVLTSLFPVVMKLLVEQFLFVHFESQPIT